MCNLHQSLPEPQKNILRLRTTAPGGCTRHLTALTPRNPWACTLFARISARHAFQGVSGIAVP